MKLSTTLAVYLPNWVGDVVMALPALAHLRGRGLALHCFGRPWAGDLIAPFPDRFDPIGGNLLADARRIRSSGAERGLILANSLASGVCMYAAGIRATGYARRGRSPLLGTAIAWRGRPRHEIDSFVSLARACSDLDPPEQSVEPRLPPTDSQRAEGLAALKRHEIDRPYVVFAPFAAGRVGGKNKCWPLFPRLLEEVRTSGRPVVVCPGPGEEDRCRKLSPGARVLPGLGLGAYAAVVAGSSVVVANDSGPMHLAAAVGATVVAIFGVSDPARTGPRGQDCRILGGPGGWPSFDEVREVVLGRLGENGPSGRSEPCVP